MIIISLDEGGRFEQIQSPQCMLIGGIVFQCQTDEDLEQEKKNLQYFFKTICTEQGCNYPYDLHYNWKDGQVINAENAEKVKNALEAEMQDFLRMRGRWVKYRPAKSCYHVFCMAGDAHGLNEQSKSNLRDDVAAIRYEHMVYRTIENILFYNPKFLNETDIRLSLPTRVTTAKTLVQKTQMQELGYRKLQKDKNTFVPDTYHVTDESSFRTCLESALLNSDRDDLTFELSIQSINYEAPQFHQMFLYLADTMCSIWQNAIKVLRTKEEALPALQEQGNKLAYSGNTMLWAYHKTDQNWRSCWNDFRHGNWFEALKTASEIKASRSPIDKTYSEIWIPPFEKALSETTDFSALSEGLFRLDKYMLDLERRQQGTGLYIMGLLKENYEKITDEKDRGKLEYRISKILTGLYNHNGDYIHVQEEYEKCIRAARYVPIEEFLGLQLDYATSLNDAERYEEAEKIAAELVANHEMLNDIRKEVYPDNKLVFDSYARALSQHGQSLAFLEHNEEAIAEFRKAMDIFEPKEGDWRMTGSFRLHALTEQRDRDGYTEAAKEFFGNGSIKKQFNAVKDGKCGNTAYGLFMFLKGLYVFDRGEYNPEDIQYIIAESSKLQQNADPRHPWEQIMKYCAFLWHGYFEKEGDHSRSEELMNVARSIQVNATGILQVIREDNELQYQNVISGKDYTDGSRVRFTYR